MDRIHCAAPRPEERLQRQLLGGDLEELLQDLPTREAHLLRLRYGISGGEPMNLSDVARNLGVTRDIARGIERRAIAAIRHRAHRVIDYIHA